MELTADWSTVSSGDSGDGDHKSTRTISDSSEVWKHTTGTTPARSRVWRVRWVIASEIEQVLELRRTKVEAGQTVVSLEACQLGSDCLNVSRGHTT